MDWNGLVQTGVASAVLYLIIDRLIPKLLDRFSEEIAKEREHSVELLDSVITRIEVVIQGLREDLKASVKVQGKEVEKITEALDEVRRNAGRGSNHP